MHDPLVGSFMKSLSSSLCGAIGAVSGGIVMNGGWWCRYAMLAGFNEAHQHCVISGVFSLWNHLASSSLLLSIQVLHEALEPRAE